MKNRLLILLLFGDKVEIFEKRKKLLTKVFFYDIIYLQ